MQPFARSGLIGQVHFDGFYLQLAPGDQSGVGALAKLAEHVEAVVVEFGPAVIADALRLDHDHFQLRLRKLDHSMIYVLIAGSYTPFLICALGAAAWKSLAVIWGIALAGIVIKLVWMDAPRWLSTAFYLALGWCIVAIPEAIHSMPLPVLVLTALGGVAYSAGAVIYATKKPNFGSVWGFHEIFHLFTMLGSILQVIAVFLFLAVR